MDPTYWFVIHGHMFYNETHNLDLVVTATELDEALTTWVKWWRDVYADQPIDFDTIVAQFEHNLNQADDDPITQPAGFSIRANRLPEGTPRPGYVMPWSGNLDPTDIDNPVTAAFTITDRDIIGIAKQVMTDPPAG